MDLFNKLKVMQSESLLKKHLTEAIFIKLKDKRTKFGGTLSECIKAGCLHSNRAVAVIACDPDAYTVFGDLFSPIIREHHNVAEVEHPKPDMGDLNKLPPFDTLDPTNEYIVSTRVRVCRSHAGFGFPPVINNAQRKEMEKLSCKAFKKLPKELQGDYYSLEKMTKETQIELVQQHCLFNSDNTYLCDAGVYVDWPVGRGVFFNKDRTFLVWVNEEDHLRFISMQPGGNFKEVYSRLGLAMKSLEYSSGLKFATHPKLGYLTFCPSNLGTGLRASVHIKVPKLAAKAGTKSDNTALDDVCEQKNLQKRGTYGEYTESVGGVYDISNKNRLGLTELEAATVLYEGIKEIIKREKAL